MNIPIPHHNLTSVHSEELSELLDEGEPETLKLWNKQYSDDRSMQRRHSVRRQRAVLDDEQTKDAMKLLEKYVRRKYRNSMLVSQDGGVDQFCDQSGTPVGHTQSACQLPRQGTAADRLSCLFNSTHLGPLPSEAYFPPNSPVFPSSQKTSFRSEIRFKEWESIWTNFTRIAKYLYTFLGFRYIFLACVIGGYACLGGWVFMTLEEENQMLDLEQERMEVFNESRVLARNLLDYLREKNCSSTNDELCLRLITKAFVERSDKVERNIRGEGWRWDFWNSVFFAATIFTTIGYGNLACKTNVGRIATIIYGLIGIPLTLFVLKVYGELAIAAAQAVRVFVRRKLRACGRKLKRFDTIESVASEDVPQQKENLESSEDEENTFATFPVKWALFIVFLFMVICSFIVSFWEKWDFLTAFYFFFVSLSTIGFGDVIPEHPRTACGLFLLYFVGLALFSMVYAILQERVENQYMWALELIDQEYNENQKAEICEAEEQPDKTTNGADGTVPKVSSQNSIRWRQKTSGQSIENMPDRPGSERRLSVILQGESPRPAPPVLGAFFLHNLSVKRRLIARSESILNKAGTKRPTSLFPSNERLSTAANSTRGSPWLMSGELNHPRDQNTPGKASGLSAPNLAGGNRSPSGALSVITEASDEEPRQYKKHGRRNILTKTEEMEENSDQGSNASLDQVMDELQLECQDHPITPKPFHNPLTSFFQTRKNEETASTSEKKPLSPKEPLEEDDEDEDDGK